MESIKITELFDLTKTIAADYLSKLKEKAGHKDEQ